MYLYVSTPIPENFKKIIFKGGVVLSSIMIIHFIFILQKGREKNYIVGDEKKVILKSVRRAVVLSSVF